MINFIDDYSNDTSNDYSIVSSGIVSKVVSDGMLTVTTTSNQTLISIDKVNLAGDFNLLCDIKMIQDSAIINHAGLIIYNPILNKYLLVYFLQQRIGVDMLNNPPNYDVPWSQAHIVDASNPLSSSFVQLKVELSDKTLNIYLNNVLNLTYEVTFSPSKIGYFVYGAKVGFDNLSIDYQAYQIAGNSKQDNNVASRFVLINDWQTGDFIKKITPRANGDWEYVAPNTNKLIISHIGADGFAPKIDAPITPALV